MKPEPDTIEAIQTRPFKPALGWVHSLLLVCLLSTTASAQQMQVFDDYELHYNALTTNLLSPEIARAYGLQRSSNRALVSITIIQNGVAQRGQVTVSAKNLVGQNKRVDMREILEKDSAVYYIGELRIAHMETVNFEARIRPEGSGKAPYTLKFSQQFYTDQD